MDDNYKVSTNFSQRIARTASEVLTSPSLTLNYSKSVTTKKDFIITSIIPEITTRNKVLEKEENDFDEKIFVLKITGNVNFSQISWNIYTTPKELKGLFEQMRKDLSKSDKNIITDTMTRYFKIVKSYSIDAVYTNIEKIVSFIQFFYNKTKARDLPIFKEALRISAISFSNNNGIKPFEGYAEKKADPRYLRYVIKVIFSPLESLLFKQRNRRWIVLKDDMICYLNDPNTMIGKNVYWFDENIEINKEEDNILDIGNLSINLNLKFDTRFERDLWYKEINERIEKKRNEIMENKYHSFATQKNNCKAKWFIDGKSYFDYLFDQLINARETVYITDWFLSPPVALKRPINYNQFLGDNNNYKNSLTFDNVSRLMDILYLLAKRGVHIYILLFYEIKLALPLNSYYAKTTLKDLHPNIKITRHPKGSSSILWSHHEKLVIIDQQIAFVGGIDLCWGRYDTNEHPIVEEYRKDNLYYYPGADYMSERICEMHDVDKFYIEQIDRKKVPRIGWHDIHTMVEGPIVGDIVRHFVERWNYARSVKRNNQLVRVGVSVYGKNHKATNIDSNIRKNRTKMNLDNNINIINNEDDKDNDNEPGFIPPSKTISTKKKFKFMDKMSDNKEKEDEKDNNINKIIINKDKDKNNINNIIKEDEDDEDEKDDYILSRNFNKNRIEIEENKISNSINENVQRDTYNMFSNIKNKIKSKYEDYKNKKRKSEDKTITQDINLIEDESKDNTISTNFQIQALRSVSSWSIGLTTTEHSVLEGYYKLIDNANHYIYIENQFFITKPFSDEERKSSGLSLSKLVENGIALHIRNRIEYAYEKKQNFRVFICIPLLPGFPGVPGENNTLDAVLKYTLQSIGNNKGYSLLELLRKKIGNDLENYIYFFSLRNHSTLHGVPVTEQIYIHSKLLIIDDQKVLIGSANINDRSMLGIRDSEFAVIMEEENNCKSIMDNKAYMGSNYAISLRKALMAEHFNIDVNDEILDDPISEKLWHTMKVKAKNNTFIYDIIFDCFPHNKFNTFKKLKERRLFKTKEEIEELKQNYKNNIGNIDGHIVEYPYEFLKDEELGIDFFSKENLVPERNFT